MAKEKRPCMPFYGREFYDDENVLVMTLEQQGAYMRLLWKCWSEGSIPADEAKLAAILALPVPRFKAIWPGLLPLFTEHETRLIHEKVEEIRAELNSFTERKRQGGKTAMAKRWQKDKTVITDLSTSYDTADNRSITSDLRSPISIIPKPQEPTGRTPDALQAAFERCMELHPNVTDADAAARAFISLVGAGKITEADAPLMVAGMQRWTQCADWVDGDPKFMGKGPAKEFYNSFAAWVRERAWTSQPKLSAKAEAESAQPEFTRAPAGWQMPGVA